MKGKTKANEPLNQRTFDLAHQRSAVLTEVDADRPWEVEYCQPDVVFGRPSSIYVRYFSGRSNAVCAIMDFGTSGVISGHEAPNFTGPDEHFDGLPEEVRVDRRADRGFSVRGSSPIGYQPRRRAPRARDRVLYAVPGVVTFACISGLIAMMIFLFGAALNWW